MTQPERFASLRRLLRPNLVSTCLLSIAMVAAATALHRAMAPHLVGVPFILQFPVVIASSLLWGSTVGAFTVAISALFSWYFILEPAFSFSLQSADEVVALVLFTAVSLTIVGLSGTLRRVNDNARLANLNMIAANASLASVFEANPDGIVLTDTKGRMLQVNCRMTQMFGRPRDALIGSNIEMLLPERLRTHHAAHHAAFMADPKPREMGAGLELFGLRRDNTEFPVDVQIGSIHADGEIRAVAVVRDLTEHKALQRELIDRRQKQSILEERQRNAEELRLWAEVFKSAAIGIKICEAKSGAVYSINPVCAAMHGLTAEEARQMVFADFYAEDERTRLPGLLAAANEAGQVVFQSRHRRKDGSTFPVEVHLSSMRDDSGALRYHVASSRDLTESKLTEEALRQAQKMEAIGNVAGGMAHDFNNLLGVIMLNLDVARSLLHRSHPATELVGEAFDAAVSGAELTSRLLAFARRQTLRPTHILVNERVSSMHRLLSRVLGENIEFALELAPDVWPVIADVSQVETSIVNLVSNARDAMPKGGKLTITTGNRRLDAAMVVPDQTVICGDYVMIEVSDTGVGMTPEVMAKIFEPFYTTKEPGKGTGLGLSMVFGFSRQSAGYVSAYSEFGIGTTIRLFLPRAVDIAAKTTMQSVEVASASGQGETILVVEDNVAMRRSVVTQLSSLGYSVLEAGNVEAALAVLQITDVHLVFTDVVMPGAMDGFELAALARVRWPATKVVLTSGFAGGSPDRTSKDLERSVRLLSKPYGCDQLARTIREALDGEEIGQ